MNHPVQGGGSAVETDGLCLDYGSRRALSDVTLAVAPGEVFGLLGPNGGGKSTLFSVLATLLHPSRGAARVLGLDVVRDADAIRRHIGVVFQAPALDGQLTARENLRHQGHLQGLHGKDLGRRVGEMLERFGLGDRRDERVSRMSGGLRRRVDLARGLLHGPRLLILDEPSAGLDPVARRELRDHLARERDAEGLTVLLTTHLMDEAEACDRIAILDGGKVVALDTPEALKRSVGGDVVSVRAESPERVQEAVRARFGAEASVIDGTVRVACRDGQAVVLELLRAFGDKVLTITLGRPTLEDAFIQRTGHRLDSES